MIATLMAFSVRARWAVVLFFLVVAGFGAWQLTRLPIDAVPDITNKQVQVNTVAPALSPVEIEKQVTFPIETALAGIAGLESTRSLSRNGFSPGHRDLQRRPTSISRASRSASASIEARQPPAGVDPKMGPISTGLGEIYIGRSPTRRRRRIRVMAVGWQSDGSFLTPEGERLTDESAAAYLRTVQDWIVRPQMRGVPGVAGVDSIGGYAKQFQVRARSDEAVGYGSPIPTSPAHRGQQCQPSAPITSSAAARHLAVPMRRIHWKPSTRSAMRRQRHARGAGRVSDVAEVAIGGELRTGSASVNGHEAVIGTALMLVGEQQPHGRAGVGEQNSIRFAKHAARRASSSPPCSIARSWSMPR
jgi:cobalt-zinc-cadmium resistance protein CzcA